DRSGTGEFRAREDWMGRAALFERKKTVSTIPAQPQQASADAAVSLKDVRITFLDRSGASYTAVADADLEVSDGQFVAIVGPTGCGKSTLLNVAAGLLTPSAGKCTIFGEELRGLNRKAGYL